VYAPGTLDGVADSPPRGRVSDSRLRQTDAVFLRAPNALIPPLRAYLRWAPGSFGKRTLWTRVAQPLARRPRPFVARTAYGFTIAGDQRLIMPRCTYWFGSWEPPLSEWIRRALQPGDVFVDVGANFGYYTLLAARAVAPGGSVVAVEASPSTAHRLLDNIARNRVQNVRVVQAAAVAEHGAVPFYRASNDAENSTVPRRGVEPAGEVRALPLPDLLTETELRRTRVIKIDVEGGELAVLRGLRPAAEALRGDAVIAVEAHHHMLAVQGATLSDLLDVLRPAGFEALELPVDISELAHLFPEHPDPSPLRPDGSSLRHLILSRGARDGATGVHADSLAEFTPRRRARALRS
jgi:FkbM family methyltransferase